MSSLESRTAKDGRIWWQVRYQWNGQQERIKIGVTSKRVAKQRQAQIDNLLAMSRNPNEELKQISGIKLSELLDKDSVWCSSRMQPKTIQLNKRSMNLLQEFAGDVDFRKIDNNLIERFLIYLKEKLKFNPTTINMQLRQLKAIFQRAIDEYGILKEHPFRRVKQYSVPTQKGRIAYLTVEQVAILLNCIENVYLLQLVKFYLWTGCRRSEAIDLQWDDIDSLNGLINLGQLKSKTKLRRELPINNKLKELLLDLERDSNGSNFVFRRFNEHNPAYVTTLLETIRKKNIELPDTLSPHLLRHTFASHLVMHGVDLTTIASFLGHSTAKVTERYAHLQPDHKLSCLNKLPY